MALNDTLPCPRCGTSWSTELVGDGEWRECPGCGRVTSVTTFPALRQPSIGAALPEKLVVEGEASCFYHPDKRATIPCSACGRFLCALCDVTVGERHLCPGCIESGRTKGKFVEFETSRTLWDSAALMLAVLPLLICFYSTVIFAPAALGTAIVGWRKPSSIIPRGRWRLWLAVVLSTLQIGAWIAGVVWFIKFRA